MRDQAKIQSLEAEQDRLLEALRSISRLDNNKRIFLVGVTAINIAKDALSVNARGR